MIFYLKAAQNLVAWQYERDFDMIFHSKRDFDMIFHSKRDFDMIFHFKATQNLVTEHYERDFDTISTLWWIKTCLQSNVKEILT